MDRLNEITLGDLGRGVRRYQAFIAVITAILLISVFVPDEELDAGGNVATQLTNPTQGPRSTTSDLPQNTPAEAAEQVAPEVEQDDVQGSAGVDTGSAPATPPEAGGASSPAGPWQAAESPLDLLGSPEALSSPNCDPETGRLKFPTNYAAPCLPLWPRDADNGGATARGVTSDTITIAIRECPGNPAQQAALSAAGADESDAEQREYLQGFLDIYNSHYYTYGRRASFEFFDSGCSGEEQSRADAQRVAHDLQAFGAIVINEDAAFADALSREGVVNVTLDGPPRDTTLKRAPYSWSRLKNPESQLAILAEYVGKRLKGGQARWAGDTSMHVQERKFGFIYPDDPAVFGPGSLEYFRQQLARYNVSLSAAVGVDPSPAAAQEQSRPAIAKLQDAGVTSVLLYADYLLTAFMTNESTRQAYYPEWVMAGALLQDGTIFGRTYDQSQWSNAFGISALQSAQSRELYNNHVLYTWHHEEPPPGNTSVSVQPVIDILFLGIHLAGPNLTPETFGQGLFFGYPPSGGAAHGFRLTNQWSFGDKGFWDWSDYSAGDDVKEVWWDPQAQGEDELGNYGQGMYREVDLGKRYTIGELPSSEPRVFDRSNTSTLYEEYPPGEDPRGYECRSYKWEYEPEGPCGN